MDSSNLQPLQPWGLGLGEPGPGPGGCGGPACRQRVAQDATFAMISKLDECRCFQMAYLAAKLILALFEPRDPKNVKIGHCHIFGSLTGPGLTSQDPPWLGPGPSQGGVLKFWKFQNAHAFREKLIERGSKRIRIPIEMGVDLLIKTTSTSQKITYPERGASVGG